MKKSGQFLFDAKIKWRQDTNGILTSGKAGTIEAAAPKVQKGGKEESWSPESLLLAAVSSSVMTTCLFYAKHRSLALTGFECETVGRVELHHGKLKFSEINIYPVLGIENPAMERKANEVIELTKQYCLVARALAVITYYHPVISAMYPLPVKKQKAGQSKREVFF